MVCSKCFMWDKKDQCDPENNKYHQVYVTTFEEKE